ncbi:translation initiation factor IF-2-like [Corvus kubaryi]|uniref:translation initiation factor IF-2-like n=1 Tax=Corvus kubaryi TaxID=68294 RepID=UPI001C04583D|nr:translation initiation factor IF-2-like [Corvus kubaryi]
MVSALCDPSAVSEAVRAAEPNPPGSAAPRGRVQDGRRSPPGSGGGSGSGSAAPQPRLQLRRSDGRGRHSPAPGTRPRPPGPAPGPTGPSPGSPRSARDTSGLGRARTAPPGILGPARGKVLRRPRCCHIRHGANSRDATVPAPTRELLPETRGTQAAPKVASLPFFSPFPLAQRLEGAEPRRGERPGGVGIGRLGRAGDEDAGAGPEEAAGGERGLGPERFVPRRAPHLPRPCHPRPAPLRPGPALGGGTGCRSAPPRPPGLYLPAGPAPFRAM